MTHDYSTIEALASRLCHDSGGTWDKKRTKRNHWRAKAKAQLDEIKSGPRSQWFMKIMNFLGRV